MQMEMDTMVETEEGGAVFQLELCGDQVAAGERANEKMPSETENGTPKCNTDFREEGRTLYISYSFPVIPEKEQSFQDI